MLALKLRIAWLPIEICSCVLLLSTSHMVYIFLLKLWPLNLLLGLNYWVIWLIIAKVGALRWVVQLMRVLFHIALLFSYAKLLYRLLMILKISFVIGTCVGIPTEHLLGIIVGVTQLL